MFQFDRKTNLKTFDQYEYHIAFEEDNSFDKSKIKIHYPQVTKVKTLYSINNILTHRECNELIKSLDNKYQNLEKEYLKEVRDNKRLLMINQKLSSIIWNRIQDLVNLDFKNSYFNIIPFGFGTEGVWEPYSLNECFRCNEYQSPNVGFKYHRDSCFVRNENERSIFTLLIYLNDNFEGGETNFYKSYGKRIAGETIKEEISRGVYKIYSHKPNKGEGIIFNHDLLHEGNSVGVGTKYVLRTDVIFRRIKVNEFYNPDWRSDPQFIKTIEIYREAGNQEILGNVEKASELYERGLSMRQCQIFYDSE